MQRKYTVKEISKVLRVGTTIVHKWINQGKIKAFRLPGGYFRICQEDFTEFLKTYDMPEKLLEELEDTGKKIRVLVIDDDVDVRKTLGGFFKKKKEFDVQTASNSIEGGSKLMEFKPHIIMVDRCMGSGKNIREVLYKNPELRSPKVISISGSRPLDDEEIEKEGYDAFLGKPFDFGVMLETIYTLI